VATTDAQIESALRRFAESTDDLVTIVDAGGRFLWVSPSCRRFFGLEPDDCAGRSAFEFVHEEDQAATRGAFEGWLRDPADGSISFENRQVARDRTVRNVLWTIHRMGPAGDGEVRFVSAGRDITRLRRVQGRLAASEARTRALLSGMLDPVITIDIQGTIRAASNSVETVFGWPPEDLVGRNVKVLMGEPYHSEHDGYLDHYSKTGETGILGRMREFEVIRRDGERILCELSVSRVDVPGQAETLFCGSFRDVTARRRAERSLAESERRLRAIFDQEYQYVGLLDTEGSLLEVNETALGSARCAREEVLGRPFWLTPWWSHSEEGRDVVEDAVRRAAAGEFVRFETEFSAPGGETRTFDFSIKPVRDDEGEIVLLLPEGRDITEFKQAQKREVAVLRALAHIGESAAVLAHEIKNPITAVNLALRAVADQLGEDDRSVLEELVGRMQRLEQLMRSTLTFARPLDLDLREVSVDELLAGPVSDVEPLLAGRSAALERDVAAGLPGLRVDVRRMEEVLENLLRNAAEMIGDGGRVRLSAHAVGAHAVELVVEDDGPGIPEAVREDLFRPFVTTKDEGTGLGLALARKVVEEHEGAIEAGASELGGARFRVVLPAHAG
jgi:PAS domain S-box-containing protein